MTSSAIDQSDDARRWDVLQSRRQQVLTVQAVELFRSHSLEPLVIKGVAAARYYPQNVYRVSVDVDLAVASEDFQDAERIVEAAAIGCPIDVHQELRRLDPTSWPDLVKNSVELPLPDGNVRVLRPEDDLRVLAVHWLMDGGSNKERLWDIFYLIDRRDPGFDWDRCLSITSERRRRWLDCVAGTAEKYLGLDLTDTPFAGAAARLPKWFVRTIEGEWSAETKHIPLEAVVHDRQMLLKQLRRRLRPNAIYATVDCEGSFDARTRIFYKLRNMVGRVGSSYRRVSAVIGAR